MALIVTAGGLDSDAYLDVAAADARAAADLGAYASKWVAAATEVSLSGPNRLRKEAALRRATQDVDELVRSVPAVAVTGQALLFPRSLDWSTGWMIPAGIQRATYRQALYLFANADVIDAAKTRQARQLSSFTEPNVSGTIAEPSVGRFDPSLEGILQPYTVGAMVGWIALS
jgi:hypothetical protein